MFISCGLSYLKLDCLICGIFIVRKWKLTMKTQSVANNNYYYSYTVKTRMHDTQDAVFSVNRSIWIKWFRNVDIVICKFF